MLVATKMVSRWSEIRTCDARHQNRWSLKNEEISIETVTSQLALLMTFSFRFVNLSFNTKTFSPTDRGVLFPYIIFE